MMPAAFRFAGLAADGIPACCATVLIGIAYSYDPVKTFSPAALATVTIKHMHDCETCARHFVAVSPGPAGTTMRRFSASQIR
jgi:hypothetical protein